MILHDIFPTWFSRNASQKKTVAIATEKKCQLAPLIVYNRQFGGMTTTEWLKPPIGTQVSHNDTAATNSIFPFPIHNTLIPRPTLHMLVFGHVPQDYSQCLHFTHTEESPPLPVHGGESHLHTPPCAWRRVSASPPTEENLHSTAKKYILVFNLVLRSNPFQSKRLVSHWE